MPADGDGLGESGVDGVDEAGDGGVAEVVLDGGGGKVGGEDDELIAAEAGESIGGADGFAEIGCDAVEQLVAGDVAVVVVDFFEAVEVDHEEDDAGLHAAGTLEGLKEAVFEEAAVGESGELIVESEPFVIGDLVFEHDDEHADGDEELLHVPDLGDEVLPVGTVGDPGMDEEAERPDEESADDGDFSGASGGDTFLEGEAGEDVDAEEAPVCGSAVGVLMDEPGHGEPAGEVYEDEVPAAAEEVSGGKDAEKTGENGQVVGEMGGPVESAECDDAEEGDGVEDDVADAIAAGEGLEAGVRGEGEPGEDVGIELKDMQSTGQGAVGAVEGVGEGLEEDEEETQEPQVDGFSRMTSTQQNEDDHEDGHRREVREQIKVDHVSRALHGSQQIDPRRLLMMQRELND